MWEMLNISQSKPLLGISQWLKHLSLPNPSRNFPKPVRSESWSKKNEKCPEARATKVQAKTHQRQYRVTTTFRPDIQLWWSLHSSLNHSVKLPSIPVNNQRLHRSTAFHGAPVNFALLFLPTERFEGPGPWEWNPSLFPSTWWNQSKATNIWRFCG